MFWASTVFTRAQKTHEKEERLQDTVKYFASFPVRCRRRRLSVVLVVCSAVVSVRSGRAHTAAAAAVVLGGGGENLSFVCVLSAAREGERGARRGSDTYSEKCGTYVLDGQRESPQMARNFRKPVPVLRGWEVEWLGQRFSTFFG